MNRVEAAKFSVKINDFLSRASGGKCDFAPLWVTDPGISSLKSSQWARMYRILEQMKRTCQCCGGSAWHTSLSGETFFGVPVLTLRKCDACDENGMQQFISEN